MKKQDKKTEKKNSKDKSIEEEIKQKDKETSKEMQKLIIKGDKIETILSDLKQKVNDSGIFKSSDEADLQKFLKETEEGLSKLARKKLNSTGGKK